MMYKIRKEARVVELVEEVVVTDEDGGGGRRSGRKRQQVCMKATY